jgi:DNA-binding GntR family transcriptional regulator
MANATDITERIRAAVLGKKLQPGSPLGEMQLAMLFDCSRTIVREALLRLAERGIVTLGGRRGWHVVELSEDQARETFEARLVLETGLLRASKPLSKPALERLRSHISRQQAALKDDDDGQRSFLLGDFHVCLAECLGNRVLAETLRDYTARTTLIALRYQSAHDAGRSCSEHAAIVKALESGDMAEAERLMAEHLSTWEAKLPVPGDPDPLARLREALLPFGPGASGSIPSSLTTTTTNSSGAIQ